MPEGYGGTECDSTCLLVVILVPVYHELKGRPVPNTIPPFHFTKAANSARTEAYGMNDGRMSSRIFGALRIDWIKSTGDSDRQNADH